MTARKAGRLFGLGVITVVAVGMAIWAALGQPGIGESHGIGSAFRDSDLDSNVPPDYTACQGSCPGGYFDDNKEIWVGTNPLDPCANTTTVNDEEDDKWPPDFDDNRTVNILDVVKGFTGRMDVCQGNPLYLQRSDLNADTCITMDDVNIMQPYIGKTCSELFADPDGDGFPTIYETEMGTDPNDNCGANAWPPDTNNDTVVNILDMVAYTGKVINCWPNSVFTGNTRLDMNADRCLDDVVDVMIVGKYIGDQCTP
jgi:hypothetical protein